ncbi:MAG: glycine cleavage system aminomethyltransferase GcvT [Phycisphaeraceae bacterium]|nr:MAG: glycine cleavage system aminomethyltransferase GcvT [Phycisphaeraceae bacterium]
MRRTPLHGFHLEHKAHMVEFAGWEMPLYYSGILEEHAQVRTSGGLFDVSHMGRVKVTGRHARRFLERVCSRRVSDMTAGQCRYSLVLNEGGGVRDDIIVYRLDEDDFLLVVNASNRSKLMEHFEAVRSAGDLAVKLEDHTEKTAMVALQGPRVMELIGRYSKEIPSLKRYRFSVKNLLVMKITVSRTGYTGEDGIEAILPAGAVGMAMKFLLRDVDPSAAGALIRPAGLGARDTLRIEAGMPLYGHELGEGIGAWSCGVDFAITMEKDGDARGEPFVGQEALRRVMSEGGPKHRLVGLELEGRRAARQGMSVLSGETAVGTVTSGCLSPSLGKSIAMAFVEPSRVEVGSAVRVETGKGSVLEGRVVPMPFYKAAK